MKKLLSLLTLLFVLSFTVFPQVAINISGNAADASAMLDVSSTSFGILIPRMTAGNRVSIASPVQGLLVYQTNGTIGFYYYNGSSWNFLLNNTYNTYISDSDGNTKIQAEESPDEDIIRFDMGGVEYFTMQNGRFDILNTGESVFIGEDAGEVDDLSDNKNVFVGYHAGKSNTTGYHNTVYGAYADCYNQTGSNNTIMGHKAGAWSAIHSKSGNVFLGYYAGFFETGDNKLYIENSNSASPLIYGEFDNDLLRVNGTLDINNAYQLPTIDGSNGQFITTDGSGVLSWTSNDDGDITSVGSMTSGDAFANYSADGQWLGLGSSAGRIEFDAQTPDVVNILSANVGIGTSAPTEKLTLHNGNLLITNSSFARELRLSEPFSNGTKYTAFKAQAQLNNITYTLPATDGSTGQLLETDGSGILTWTDDGGAVDIDDLTDGKTGGYSVYLGTDAGLGFNGSAGYNVAIGYSAAYSNTNKENVAIGYMADYYNNGGSGNVIIGYKAGCGSTTHDKSGNVFIGRFAGCNETGDNKLYIDNISSASPLIYGEFDDDLVTIYGNLGVGTKEFGSGSRALALRNGTVPTSSITDGVLLYTEEVSSELKVRDESGQITTLSPHNFSMTTKSEPMAWSYYSENAGIGKKINVDMLKTVRLIEKITGEKLAFIQDVEDTAGNANIKESTMGTIEQQQQEIDELHGFVETLRVQNAALLKRIEKLEEK